MKKVFWFTYDLIVFLFKLTIALALIGGVGFGLFCIIKASIDISKLGLIEKYGNSDSITFGLILYYIFGALFIFGFFLIESELFQAIVIIIVGLACLSFCLPIFIGNRYWFIDDLFDHRDVYISSIWVSTMKDKRTAKRQEKNYKKFEERNKKIIEENKKYAEEMLRKQKKMI